MDKRGIEIGFAWIFAILAGMAILFLAVYFATQLVGTSEREITTKTADSLVNALDPLQTTVQEGSGRVVDLPSESRVYTSCNNFDEFGNTVVELEERLLGGKWSQRGGGISTSNAYLFAENMIEGKEINFFIFQFRMPFKVVDILTAYTTPYCFVDPPTEIKNEILGLSTENSKIFVEDSESSCSSESTSVCFDIGNCDINVDCRDTKCTEGNVIRNGEVISFVDKLLYAAIFSSKENYECNVGRVMTRLESLSSIYQQKAQFVAIRGCNTGLVGPKIALLGESASDYERTRDLFNIKLLAEDIKEDNKVKECRLF